MINSVVSSGDQESYRSALGADNRLEYRRASIVERLRIREGWIDRAERLLINQIADEVRTQPLLDIGVGGGRTAWMLRLLSADYVAVDWSPEMVATCRLEYPGVDFRECDARDLSMFGTGQFAFVFFSFNGIDVVSHDDRLRVLREIHRVLKPGGLFLYSTSNKNGLYSDCRPWHVMGHRSVARTVRFLVRFLASLPHYLRTYRNWWNRRQYTEEHGSWAIRTSAAYEFTVVVHWTMPSTERKTLRSIGFRVSDLRSDVGEQFEGDSTDAPYFYLLARKDA
jgi:SAM-dependent methyltransferase